MSRLYTIVSISLLLVLALALLMMIQKLKLTIIQQKKSQDITIHSMSMLAELKDQETGEHLIRTRKYCRMLVLALERRQADFKKISRIHPSS